MTSDEWIAILTPIAVAVSIVLQRFNASKVKVALEVATEKSDSKFKTIHDLVNGNMTEQKRVTMIQAKRIANLTKDPADEALAKDSERSYKDHVDRQQASISELLPTGHRVMVTDGPSVRMIVERLSNIEQKLGTVKCMGSECPVTEPPPEKTAAILPEKSAVIVPEKSAVL